MRRLTKALPLLALLMAGCSATTWRHDTFRDVEQDGRPVLVSWIRTEPGEFDLMVFEETPQPDRAPLDAASARLVAGRFIRGKCGQHVIWLDTTRSFVDHRHAFRVRCDRE